MASASDEFVGTAALSANWTVDEGAITIVADQADATTAGSFNRARYTGTPMDSANHYSESPIPRQSGAISDKGGVTCRQASATYTCYQLVWVDEAVDGIKLRSVSGGAETQLATATGAYTVTKTLKVEANGSTIKGYVDGAEVISVTDTAVASGAYAGISIYGDSGLWVSWAAADLAAAVSDAVIHQAIYRGREMR